MKKSERLSILSAAEQFALYGLPDFDERQRTRYLSFTEQEVTLIFSRSSLSAQVHCALQIGYFNAKQAFFQFSHCESQDDHDFIVAQYFKDRTWTPQPITQYERYAQHRLISALYGYRLWSSECLPQLTQQATHIVCRDVTPGFIVTELIAYLNAQKIVRPGYTTLQTVISEALSTERKRLSELLASRLDQSIKSALQQLLVRDDTLSDLAVLKQDAKHFGYRQMVLERKKRSTLDCLYHAAKTCLPALAISHQNLNYYASLVNFYTVYDLRRLRTEQAQLYLLCYAWQRYRQFTDNLVEALGYHMKKLEDETKSRANKHYQQEQQKRQRETAQIGRLLLLYVDDGLTDALPFGTVRQHAFTIMSREAVQMTGRRLSEKPTGKLVLRWQQIDQLSSRVRKHLRPLYRTLDFASVKPNNPWIAALTWMRTVFDKQQRLSQRPFTECPEGTIPQRLRAHLLIVNTDGIETSVHADRYEFWIYRQLRKRLKSGELYLNGSAQHRSFNDDLVSLDEKASVLDQLNIPWLQNPIETQLDTLSAELQHQWRAFNRELKKGQLKHLTYDKQNKTLVWHRHHANNDTAQDNFYNKLALCDITDVFRFVNERCRFLSALKPLQPRYAKRTADDDSLMAVIIAQAMNHGNHTMAQTSDVPYHILDTTYQQHLRLATLQSANDKISNAMTELPIFAHYSFDLNALYGSVDGQKLGVERPTIKGSSGRTPENDDLPLNQLLTTHPSKCSTFRFAQKNIYQKCSHKSIIKNVWCFDKLLYKFGGSSTGPPQGLHARSGESDCARRIARPGKQRFCLPPEMPFAPAIFG